MTISTQYAILFGFAGAASAIYQIKNGKKAQSIPLYAVAACLLYTAVNYDLIYVFLTAIEFAVGFGLAHVIIDKPADKN